MHHTPRRSSCRLGHMTRSCAGTTALPGSTTRQVEASNTMFEYVHKRGVVRVQMGVQQFERSASASKAWWSPEHGAVSQNRCRNTRTTCLPPRMPHRDSHMERIVLPCTVVATVEQHSESPLPSATTTIRSSVECTQPENLRLPMHRGVTDGRGRGEKGFCSARTDFCSSSACYTPDS